MLRFEAFETDGIPVTLCMWHYIVIYQAYQTLHNRIPIKMHMWTHREQWRSITKWKYPKFLLNCLIFLSSHLQCPLDMHSKVYQSHYTSQYCAIDCAFSCILKWFSSNFICHFHDNVTSLLLSPCILLVSSSWSMHWQSSFQLWSCCTEEFYAAPAV